MDQLGHRRRTHEQRQLVVAAQDLRPSIHSTNIPQNPRPEPNAIETGLVGISCEQICCRAGVECPRLLAGSLGRHHLEIMRVDQGV